jgi:signal transduction histidine kinase
VLYHSLSTNLTDVGEETFSGPEAHQNFLHETLESTEHEIMLIDLIVLLLSAGVGYALAGYTLRPIQKSVEAQRIFSENASHELRTPLAVMKNDAEVLMRNPNPSKDLVHSTLKSNIEEIDRMTHMAEDLLLLARSDNHKLPDLETIDLARVAKEVAKKMGDIAKAKGIKLEASSSGTLNIQGNREGLQRALINIVLNAIDHTPESGKIDVVLKNENREAVIKISDTGTGIDEKDLPHIFERFYKGVGTSGNGLGLSIVKEIVDYHKGVIVIESTKNTGTTATLRFPQVG